MTDNEHGLQVAWCWASGLIEVGDKEPTGRADGGGCIAVAWGPATALRGQLEVLARHGKGKSKGLLLVPGVPEAEDQAAAADALAAWLAWCGSRPSRDGVTFARRLV